MNTKTHTDIKRDGWVERLPSFLRPYAYLARLDRPIGIWLLMLPGWWSITLANGGLVGLNGKWLIFGYFTIGAVIMRAAGCVINDLWDRELDRRVERTRLRPLASGEISVRRAIIFLIILLTMGALILIQLNLVTFLLGLLVLPLIVAYPLMKRITWWPQLFLGLTFNFGALMGWSAITGEVGLPALWLYAGGIFWTLAYDTVYAHQDKEDDALAGIKSTARLFGDHSKLVVMVFCALAGFFILMSAHQLGAVSGLLRDAFVIGATGFLFLHIVRWNPDNPESSLRTFEKSRDFGLLIFISALLLP